MSNMASNSFVLSSFGATALNRIVRRRSTVLKTKSDTPYWPNSDQSVGSYFGNIDGENYWRLKDMQCTAYITFQKLVHDLDATLEKHTEAPLTYVLWRAYMIGESACLCELGIILCCADESYRENAKFYISESCAIDVSPGAVVRYRSEPPQSRGPLVPMAGNPLRSGSPMQDIPSGRMSPYTSEIPRGVVPSHHWRTAKVVVHHASQGVADPNLAYDSIPRRTESTDEPPYQSLQGSKLPDMAERSLGFTPCYLAASGDLKSGQALHVQRAEGGAQASALGGVIQIQDKVCLMTAAHSFTTQNPVYNETFETGEFDNMISIGELLFSSILDGHPELDYALIQIKEGVSFTGGSVLIPSPNEYFKFPSFTAEASLKSLLDRTVTSTTASAGTVHGQIETVPDLMRSPGAKKSHEVHAVQFKGSLAGGDSGSWVIAAESGILHGHIVAGVPQDGLTFIVPAHMVFADIERVFAAVPTDHAGRVRSATGHWYYT